MAGQLLNSLVKVETKLGHFNFYEQSLAFWGLDPVATSALCVLYCPCMYNYV